MIGNPHKTVARNLETFKVYLRYSSQTWIFDYSIANFNEVINFVPVGSHNNLSL